ncbi:MAG: GTP-binding protein, partial [Lachnospiraceae bacterium]|nr:GTP-binding protein [Lachnospiraceae bacterium]
MNNIIIGTAGHVDHGKTCLIKALTGTDTDRLAEEKKRGITIENGFASLPNEEGLRIGIIDVPGHEKFIRNMLAGIGGIDLVLLIIALDEGIMPQTREHFEILKMLHIPRGILVFTKRDLADEELIRMVEAETD